ncbi:hypothetical protein SDC9_152404 [bioreactor metagenome]|uniref:Uncharacterized protein n=1 Tax=bioreactor metagenome TaxID=1076179 RepID=A0A645EXJ2_9ZZZZ
MVENTVPHLEGQVETRAVVFEFFHDTEALHVVLKSAGKQLVEHVLAGVSKRRVPEIVPQRDCLRQVFVEPQRAGDRPRNLADLQRMRQPRAVMVALRREEHLRFVLEPSEGLAVENAVPVADKIRPNLAEFHGRFAPARVLREHGIGRERFRLNALVILPWVFLCHCRTSDLRVIIRRKRRNSLFSVDSARKKPRPERIRRGLR